MSFKSEVLIESKSLRESVIDRVDVLDKVKKLSMMPDDINASTEMVAEYYEVPIKTIQTTIVKNRNELNGDGLKVIKGTELTLLKEVSAIPKNAPSFTMIPRRAVLRIGMLLQDSIVAQAVRDYLLDSETKQSTVVPVQIPAEINMIGQLLEISNQSYKAMMQMQSQIDNAKLIAGEAIRKAEESENKSKELESELNDVRSGLVDVNLPLRTQFNDSVRKYAKRHSLEWDEAYNNVYSILGKQNHVDLKKRLQNRVEKGEKVKMVDLVEELNLLVPAIRLAKTLAGVAS